MDEEEELVKETGATNLQLEEMLGDCDSSSDDGSYLVDFRDFQFSQTKLSEGKYITAATEIGKLERKRKLAAIRDKKSLLLDSGSTFSACNNLRMLINIRECKQAHQWHLKWRCANYKEGRGLAGIFHSIL